MNASFLDAVQVNGPTLLKSTLNVTQNASFLSAVQIDGPTLLKSTLNVSMNASFLDAVQVNGPTILKDTLNVSRNASFLDAVQIDGPVRMNASMVVARNASFLEAVQVDGPTILKATLNVSMNASFLDSVQINGSTFLKSTLNVSMNASFLDAVQIDGPTRLNSTLNVSGDANFNHVNVTSLLINGLPAGSGGMGSNIYWNVYSVPNKTVDYALSNSNRNTLLNVSYVAPVAGFYQVDGYFNLTTNIRTTWSAYLQTNNASNVSASYISPFVKSSYFIQNINEVIKLNLGERVDLNIVCGVNASLSNVSLTTTGSKFRTSLVGSF